MAGAIESSGAEVGVELAAEVEVVAEATEGVELEAKSSSPEIAVEFAAQRSSRSFSSLLILNRC